MSKGDGALNSYLREVGQVPLLTPDEEVELVILPVKNAVSPAIQSVFELHVFLHVEENERAEFFPLESCGRVRANCAFASRSAGKSAGISRFSDPASWSNRSS
jgi:hypothetical protein